MFDNKLGRSLIEITFTVLVIFIISAVFTRYWIVNLKEAREVTLENQLTNIKLSLELYMILEGRHPEDLRELDKKYKLKIDDSIYERRYLDDQFFDEGRYPVDPYGHRFLYDSKTASVKKGGKK